MMKILTQKMLGAQGLGAKCQDFVVCQNFVLSEARNPVRAGIANQQVPPRVRSSE